MTDRLKGVVVTFERDIRHDDAEALMNAIRCLRGVVAVSASLSTIDDTINRARIDREWQDRLHALMNPPRPEKP